MLATNTKIVNASEYWRVGILSLSRCQNIGLSENEFQWSEYWAVGILGCWNIGLSEYWDVGILGAPLSYMYLPSAWFLVLEYGSGS